jgi:hypothetical protein
VIVAPIRALARGWAAVGDNGLILLRSQDVLTRNHPLLGSWSSASLRAGEPISHPGPLWFDVLAPFVRIGGPSVGFALGVMASNAAAVVVAAWAARRAGGTPALLVVTTLSAGLAWSMGSELLFDAWQPHAMLLPFWAALVLAWALGTGDLLVAPVFVGVASLVVQTHVSFVYALALVAAFGLVGAVWSARSRARTADPSDGAGARRSTRWAIAASAVVAGLAWIQPLIDQATGEGNITALITAGSSGAGATIGPRIGTRIVASVVALPPWWGRSGFDQTIVGTRIVDGELDLTTSEVAGGAATASALVVVALVLGAVGAFGWGRRSRPILTLAVLAAVAILAAVVTAAVIPVTELGFGPHQLRWLWPISMLVPACVGFAVATEIPRRFALPAGVAGVSLFAAMAMPTHGAPVGAGGERDQTATVMQLLEQLESYRPDDPVVYDATVLRFGEPYSGPTLAAFARNGVEFVAADEITVRQIGRRREADGSERWRVFQVEGEAADATPAGARRIAYANGLSEQERAELEELRAFWLVELSGDDAVPEPADRGPTWQRFVELETRRINFTVALFEAPLSSAASS